jgi:hypothetical protein
MSDDRRDEDNRNIDVEKRTVNREEKPGLVGATFIKYAAYIIILLIVLYFVVQYVFPMI